MLYGLPSNTSARSPQSCIYGDTFRIKNITDHEVMIGWSLKPNCDRRNMLEQIEVRSQLTKICACESCDTPRNYYEKSSNLNTSEEPFVATVTAEQEGLTIGTSNSLKPYSEYEIQIRSLSTSLRKTLIARTKSGEPDNIPMVDTSQTTRATTQSINFFWKSSEEKECKLQNGIPDGYRVELWGKDKWALPNQVRGDNNILIETRNNIESGYYYAQNLKPYTNYLLKVFNKNIREETENTIGSTDLYNHKKYHRINIQTLPTKPDPVRHLEAKSQSYSSVHLRWVPSYPPTGRIAKYILKEGEISDKTGSITWTNFKEFDPSKQASLCSSTTMNMNTSFNDPYCCVISDLIPETTHFFSVQVFNVNVSIGSEFSETFNVTTDSSPLALPTSPTVLASSEDSDERQLSVTPTTNLSVSKPDENDSNSTAVVVVLSISVLLLVGVCFLLRRKIRQTTEKILLRSGYLSSIRPEVGDSSLVTFNTSNPNMDAEDTRTTSIASSYQMRPASPSFESHVIRDVVNQIEEIQSRKLPDAPNSSPPQASTFSANGVDHKGEVLWGLELQRMEEEKSGNARSLPLPPVRRVNYSYNDDSARMEPHSSTPQHPMHRHDPPDIITQHKPSPISKRSDENATSAIANSSIQRIPINNLEDEECTDTYGYLRPTFLRPNSIQGQPDSPNVEKPPIPTESYTRVEGFSLGFPYSQEDGEMRLGDNATVTLRPYSNDSELSFSNLRTHNMGPQSQKTNVELEEHLLISQKSMNV